MRNGFAQRHAEAAPFGLEVGPEMGGRPVSIGPVRSGLDLSFRAHMGGERLGPAVELGEDRLVLHHVLRLVLAVGNSPAELDVAPESIRHLDAAVAALPDQRSIGVPHALERLPLRIEVLGMPEDRRPAILVQFVPAAVAITKEAGAAPFQVIAAQIVPLRRAGERDGQLGILVADQIFSRIAAVHADSRSNIALRLLLTPYQLTGPMMAQASARSSRAYRSRFHIRSGM